MFIKQEDIKKIDKLVKERLEKANLSIQSNTTSDGMLTLLKKANFELYGEKENLQKVEIDTNFINTLKKIYNLAKEKGANKLLVIAETYLEYFTGSNFSNNENSKNKVKQEDIKKIDKLVKEKLEKANLPIQSNTTSDGMLTLLKNTNNKLYGEKENLQGLEIDANFINTLKKIYNLAKEKGANKLLIIAETYLEYFTGSNFNNNENSKNENSKNKVKQEQEQQIPKNDNKKSEDEIEVKENSSIFDVLEEVKNKYKLLKDKLITIENLQNQIDIVGNQLLSGDMEFDNVDDLSNKVEETLNELGIDKNLKEKFMELYNSNKKDNDIKHNQKILETIVNKYKSKFAEDQKKVKEDIDKLDKKQVELNKKVLEVSFDKTLKDVTNLENVFDRFIELSNKGKLNNDESVEFRELKKIVNNNLEFFNLYKKNKKNSLSNEDFINLLKTTLIQLYISKEETKKTMGNKSIKSNLFEDLYKTLTLGLGTTKLFNERVLMKEIKYNKKVDILTILNNEKLFIEKNIKKLNIIKAYNFIIDLEKDSTKVFSNIFKNKVQQLLIAVQSLIKYDINISSVIQKGNNINNILIKLNKFFILDNINTELEKISNNSTFKYKMYMLDKILFTTLDKATVLFQSIMGKKININLNKIKLSNYKYTPIVDADNYSDIYNFLFKSKGKGGEGSLKGASQTVARKVNKGQYFTPVEVAEDIYNFLNIPLDKSTIIDPFAGSGTLLSFMTKEKVKPAKVIYNELDTNLYNEFTSIAPKVFKNYTSLNMDGIKELCFDKKLNGINTIIANPPFSVQGDIKTDRLLDMNKEQNKILAIGDFLNKYLSGAGEYTKIKSEIIPFILSALYSDVNSDGNKYGIIANITSAGALDKKNIGRARDLIDEYFIHIASIKLDSSLFKKRGYDISVDMELNIYILSQPGVFDHKTIKNLLNTDVLNPITISYKDFDINKIRKEPLYKLFNYYIEKNYNKKVKQNEISLYSNILDQYFVELERGLVKKYDLSNNKYILSLIKNAIKYHKLHIKSHLLEDTIIPNFKTYFGDDLSDTKKIYAKIDEIVLQKTYNSDGYKTLGEFIYGSMVKENIISYLFETNTHLFNVSNILGYVETADDENTIKNAIKEIVLKYDKNSYRLSLALNYNNRNIYNEYFKDMFGFNKEDIVIKIKDKNLGDNDLKDIVKTTIKYYVIMSDKTISFPEIDINTKEGGLFIENISNYIIDELKKHPVFGNKVDSIEEMKNIVVGYTQGVFSDWEQGIGGVINNYDNTIILKVYLMYVLILTGEYLLKYFKENNEENIKIGFGNHGAIIDKTYLSMFEYIYGYKDYKFYSTEENIFNPEKKSLNLQLLFKQKKYYNEYTNILLSIRKEMLDNKGVMEEKNIYKSLINSFGISAITENTLGKGYRRPITNVISNILSKYLNNYLKLEGKEKKLEEQLQNKQEKLIKITDGKQKEKMLKDIKLIKEQIISINEQKGLIDANSNYVDENYIEDIKKEIISSIKSEENKNLLIERVPQNDKTEVLRNKLLTLLDISKDNIIGQIKNIVLLGVKEGSDKMLIEIEKMLSNTLKDNITEIDNLLNSLQPSGKSLNDIKSEYKEKVQLFWKKVNNPIIVSTNDGDLNVFKMSVNEVKISFEKYKYLLNTIAEISACYSYGEKVDFYKKYKTYLLNGVGGNNSSIPVFISFSKFLSKKIKEVIKGNIDDIDFTNLLLQWSNNGEQKGAFTTVKETIEDRQDITVLFIELLIFGEKIVIGPLNLSQVSYLKSLYNSNNISSLLEKFSIDIEKIYNAVKTNKDYSELIEENNILSTKETLGVLSDISKSFQSVIDDTSSIIDTTYIKDYSGLSEKLFNNNGIISKIIPGLGIKDSNIEKVKYDILEKGFDTFDIKYNNKSIIENKYKLILEKIKVANTYREHLKKYYERYKANDITEKYFIRKVKNIGNIIIGKDYILDGIRNIESSFTKKIGFNKLNNISNIGEVIEIYTFIVGNYNKIFNYISGEKHRKIYFLKKLSQAIENGREDVIEVLLTKGKSIDGNFVKNLINKNIIIQEQEISNRVAQGNIPLKNLSNVKKTEFNYREQTILDGFYRPGTISYDRNSKYYYQVSDIAQLLTQKTGLLSWGTGLGKTIGGLNFSEAVLTHYEKKGEKGKTVIFVNDANIEDPRLNHIDRDEDKAYLIHKRKSISLSTQAKAFTTMKRLPKTDEELQEYKEIFKNYDYIIINYSSFSSPIGLNGIVKSGKKWGKLFSDLNVKVFLLDEAHGVKNFETNLTKMIYTAIQNTTTLDRLLLMTATPTENNLGELFSLIKFMNLVNPYLGLYKNIFKLDTAKVLKQTERKGGSGGTGEKETYTVEKITIDFNEAFGLPIGVGNAILMRQSFTPISSAGLTKTQEFNIYGNIKLGLVNIGNLVDILELFRIYRDKFDILGDKLKLKLTNIKPFERENNIKNYLLKKAKNDYVKEQMKNKGFNSIKGGNGNKKKDKINIISLLLGISEANVAPFSFINYWFKDLINIDYALILINKIKYIQEGGKGDSKLILKKYSSIADLGKNIFENIDPLNSTEINESIGIYYTILKASGENINSILSVVNKLKLEVEGQEFDFDSDYVRGIIEKKVGIKIGEKELGDSKFYFVEPKYLGDKNIIESITVEIGEKINKKMKKFNKPTFNAFIGIYSYLIETLVKVQHLYSIYLLYIQKMNDLLNNLASKGDVKKFIDVFNYFEVINRYFIQTYTELMSKNTEFLGLIQNNAFSKLKDEYGLNVHGDKTILPKILKDTLYTRVVKNMKSIYNFIGQIIDSSYIIQVQIDKYENRDIKQYIKNEGEEDILFMNAYIDNRIGNINFNEKNKKEDNVEVVGGNIDNYNKKLQEILKIMADTIKEHKSYTDLSLNLGKVISPSGQKMLLLEDIKGDIDKNIGYIL